MLRETKSNNIFVVIPFYNAAKHIVDVVAKLPELVTKIVIVDDCSPQAIPIDDLKTLEVFDKILFSKMYPL